MAPNEDTSRLKARENAIETLIDMHPNGAAYRAARTMSETLKSNLESRYNRIPEWALLDHANSLSKYEILPDSDEVWGDLLKTNNASEGTIVDESEPLKEGWEARLLRHHEKIVRAKNNSSSSSGAPLPNTPSEETGGVSSSANKSSQHSKTAVPPPRLISVLRQIFGSPSSGDLKGLLSGSSDGNISGDKGEKSESQQQHQQVNVLPNLLHSVINHPAFSSESSSSEEEDELAITVKRHLASMFEPPKKEEEEKEEGKATEDSEAKESDSAPPVAEVEPPCPANLEAIIGNVCRDIYKSKASSDNGSIHGLLIASLSILTGSLLDEDNLDDYFSNEEEGQSMPTSILEGGTSKSPDASWNPTPDSYLQVGGLLNLLNTKKGEASNKFLVDKSLSRYFAEASSVYEERIEIQKALLQTPKKSDGDGYSTPKDYLSKPSVDSIETDSPLPPLARHGSADNEDSDDIIDLDEAPDDDDGLPSNRLDSDELTNADVANVTRMLLSNIANIVGGELNFDDVVDMEGEEIDADEADDVESEEDDEEEGEGHDDSDDSQATRDYTSQETAAAAGQVAQNNRNQDETELASHGNEDGNNEEEERMMLQRALALSLAATVSAGGSDSSNSGNTYDDRKISAFKSPSERNEESKRKSSGGSTRTEDSKSDANLIPLPTPPPKDVLPRSSWNHDLSESEVATLLDPAALSSFGNVPASHVLVQLLQTMLGIMESHVGKSQKDSIDTPKKSLKTPVSSLKRTLGQLKDDTLPSKDSSREKKEFVPDSVTAQLMVAALQLSSYLRNSSICALHEILSEEDVKGLTEEGEEGEKAETIQIADSAESEDPLEEVDPVLLVVASQTALENKGFERKSAAAADITALRHTTKQKMVGIWTERASFYSVCCYLNIRCLRIFMAKCVQHGIRFSDVAGSDSGDAIYMSTKSRIAMATILTSLHDASFPAKIQDLQDCMDSFLAVDVDQTKRLYDDLLVASLRNESLFLWGIAIPFLYPDHSSRVALLKTLVEENLSFGTNELPSCFAMEDMMDLTGWSSIDIQGVKLDLVCHRFSMSDTLDCLLPQPKLRTDGYMSDGGIRDAPKNIVSLLDDFLSSVTQSPPHLTQFYFATCSRSISSLLLWNDLALSPDEYVGPDSTLQLEMNPNKFQFDPAKCADSIAIERSTANQRAVKVWGTVLSTTCFLPKTGIHRFAVKLDQCERGHVFIGVATARANTKSYVGGDKNGWGFIGTQALWHDRNKLRGDYGSVLRTGAIVVATLDTDVGTLSYGLWKDTQDSETTVGLMSPSLASMSSPRRGSGMGNGNGSMIEDWGIAFEGIPLDVKLYPAVGLYQRDDRATLYTITSSSASAGKTQVSSTVSNGHVYFPSVQESSPDHVSNIRLWNQSVCWSGITFATHLLMSSIKLLNSGTDLKSSTLLSDMLPRLASALCLVPSCIPILSAKYAMELLPFVTQCAKLIDSMILPENRRASLNVEMKKGCWLIRVSPSTDSESYVSDREYTVDFVSKTVQDDSIDTCIYGKCSKVSSVGVVRGTHLKLIEEQSDGTKSLVDARLSLDGNRFEGDYVDIEQNSAGKISGVFQPHATYAAASQEMSRTTNPCRVDLTEDELQRELIRTESVLCLAASHLAQILCSTTASSDVDGVGDLTHDESEEMKRAHAKLSHLLKSQVVAAGRLNDGASVRSSIDSVWERCKALETSDYNGGSGIVEHWQDLIYLELFTATDAPLIDISIKKKEVENKLDSSTDVSSMSTGSFSKLCPLQCTATWKNISCAMLYHSQIENYGSESAELILSASRQIMERAIRDALSGAQSSGKPRAEVFKEICFLLDSISEFMFEFAPYHQSTSTEVISEFMLIFSAIRSQDDLYTFKRMITSRTEKCVMHYVGMRAMEFLLGPDGTYEGIQLCVAVESVITGLHRLSLSKELLACSSSNLQKCAAISFQAVQDKIETLMAEITFSQDFTRLSSLVLVLCTAVEYRNTMLECFRTMTTWCRNIAFQDTDESSTEETLINSIGLYSSQQILKATAAVLHSVAASSSRDESVDRVSILQLIMNAIKEAAATFEKLYKYHSANQELKEIASDWEDRTGMLPTEKACIRAALTKNSPLMSAKTATSPCHGYLNHLLDLLHCFAQNNVFSDCLGLSSIELAGDLLAMIKSSLPSCVHLRLLRLLRSVLSTMDPSVEVTEQLFELAGGVCCYFESQLALSDEMKSSDDGLRVSDGAVAILRFLYAHSSSWRRTIHEVIITSYSFSSVCGVMSFFGGLPGCLQSGSFLIAEPEIASSLSSASSLLAGKTRSALGSNTTTMNNSAGRGVEGIVSGLCRQTALAGILCSADAKGNCEVMVLPSRLLGHDEQVIHDTKVTVRAVRVSSSEIASAAELPLLINEEMPNIAGMLLEQLNSASTSLLKASNLSEDSPDSLPSLKVLFSSAMSIRSLAVLLADPNVVHQQSRSQVQDFLALVLQLAYKHSTSPDDLSKLPVVEAKIWHLVLVRSIVHRKKLALETTPVAKLEDMLKNETSKKKDKPSILAGSSDGGYKTPPPSSLVSSFFGSAARSASRTSSGSTVAREETGGSREDDDEESQNAAHLREAAIVQMAELGLPRQWAELALRRTGDSIEAAVHFCLERGADMERLIAEEASRSSTTSSRRRGGNPRMNSSHLISQLVDMGFPRHWCVSALSATSNNVDEALTWILTNGAALAATEAEDEAKDEDSEDEAYDDLEREHQEDSDECDEVNTEEISPDVTSTEPLPSGWHGSICPIRFISGKCKINPKTLEIAGKDGGFSSVGTKGVLLTSGKWYYEAEILTAGCLQIGWGDASFAGHCNSERGDGCGDGPSSWAFDGWRRYKWHSNATEWGCRWSEGDVVGCLVDMDNMAVSFTLNGKSEEIGMGLAFSGEGFRPCSGVYCCVSFNSREKLRLILGGDGTEPFKYQPNGYRGVGEAILDAVNERQVLLQEEACLSSNGTTTSEKPSFICDFSDGEHGHELFSWQHRFCGSDASVHLGGARLLRGMASSKKSMKNSIDGSSKYTSPAAADVSSRLTKIFEKTKPTTDSKREKSKEADIASLLNAYSQILSDTENELKSACVSLNCMNAQKLVLHLIIAYSDKFTTSIFSADESPAPEDDACRQLYTILEHTASNSTWLGEAGAMAVAAEALGLGISTYDATNSDGSPNGMCAVSGHVILTGGISQFLSSACLIKTEKVKSEGIYTPWTFVAASEAAVGSHFGGALPFIRHGLQNALVTSKTLRQVILAGVRRAIRMLAVAEFTSEDGALEDSSTPGSDSDDFPGYSPDARFVCFLTGLLLSGPVKTKLSDTENEALMCSLFEGWCVGLLSGSAPWRLICATTAAGILNKCPSALSHVSSRVPTIARFLGRLESTTARRIWAERAAYPVCSKYCQSLIELLAGVKRALRLCNVPLSTTFSPKFRVDAATPLPFTFAPKPDVISECNSWEWSRGWISSNTGWEVLTGAVEIMAVEWKTPQRSITRTLMDGGEGPPFLNVGCIVMRGLDWANRSDAGNEDGQDLYEKDKLAKEMEVAEEEASAQQKPVEQNPADDPALDDNEAVKTDPPEADPADDPAEDKESKPEEVTPSKKKADKAKKIPKSKLPVGTVLSIEPWNGIPAMARRVRWHLTGEEGVYRYGGDGGRFDIAHVDINDKETRIKKRHPFPESLEQIASRYGFGQRRICNVILRLDQASKREVNKPDIQCNGILEWPDFGAGIEVECVLFSDGAMSITEKKLLYGSKDSGWEARFGDPSYNSGTCTVISPTHDDNSSLSSYEELLGSSSFIVEKLRNREQEGGRLRVTSEMRLLRSRKGKHESPEQYSALFSSPSQPQPICFDSDFHASSISLSKDKRTVTCSSSEGRGVAFGNIGFTTGVHYWEVKIEKAEIGSVYIGVAEKPGVPSGSSQSSSFGFESKPRLNRWLGWGFVNFRATYTAGAERVYGSHCHSGDTVGVMLDCDSGRISYFYDGLKYGEHILNDLGCAFENVSPFGFNADGCGSGGAGQGAPSGIDGVRSSKYPSNGAVRPRALWPVIGLKHPGDRVTMSSKWITSKGVDGVTVQENVLAVDELVCAYNDEPPMVKIPDWFVKESFLEYKRWQSGRWLRTSTRGSGSCKLSSNGLDIDLDTDPLVCAAACASIGLPIALLPGDKIDLKRSAGRLLELQEEAVVLGVYQTRLWYRLVSQKSEGGSLMEGGGRAWFWDESEAVEGGLRLIGEGKGRSVELPRIARFKPSTGLKVVYVGGAVVRSDLEIFDGSANIGTIPHGTIIPKSSVLERRLNSCGVVRFLIDHEPIGRGWISSRIRGGKEEPIVEMLPEEDSSDEEREPEAPVCQTPEDAAVLWYESYLKSTENDPSTELVSKKKAFAESFNIESMDEFSKLIHEGCISGMSALESDSFIASTYGKVSDVLPHADEIDCPFVDCAIVLAGASGDHSNEIKDLSGSVDSIAHEVALESLMHLKHEKLPSVNALLARISMLRALNRRARYALPWFSMRSAQEGSCVFGGLSGFGSSLERAGRSWDSKSNRMWVQVPSTSTRLRACKNIFFPSIKRSLLDSIMDATSTPTPLSHDEYELPREVRTVRVNRLKARQAIASEDSTLIRKHSVFSQLQRETRGWSGATLRRGFVAKGHGGQKRAFKVKLVGEGVNDYSGPYREVFTDAMLEVTDVDKEGQCPLGVLEPTPNNEAELGDGRDLFMFAKHSSSSDALMNEYLDELSNEEKDMLDSFSTLTRASTEQSREVEDAIVFLGKLVGTACRHSIPVDLPLPLGVVWDRLAEEPFHPAKSLREIDLLAYNRTKDEDQDWSAISASINALSTQRRLLNYFAEGMSSVMPVELLALFTGEQLRDLVCGNPDIDVELLRRVVEYEGYNENDPVISHLWDVLREMTTSERKLFLQFVWARNRLPLKESDFDAPFRIQKDTKGVKNGDDYPLPSASTCFFSLMLPEYPNKSMLKEKLLFAIENVTTMESDYVTNDVEVSEGWRGL